jgi:NAD(P)-dependent dehydrogenase (short-subunit alcohol dehydrogenase family)
MNNLTGKTALVTGASRGIGRASALALARAGAQVLVHYSTGEKEAEAVVAEIRAAGGTAQKVAADLRDADGAHLLAKRVREVIGHRLDILVANAGVSRAASIEETTVEAFDTLFAVNVRAPYFLVQQLLPVMCKGSSIVMISSLAARAAVGTLSAYAATKGAVDTLVTHFASALGERGIRVNAVAPGVVETDMSAMRSLFLHPTPHAGSRAKRYESMEARSSDASREAPNSRRLCNIGQRQIPEFNVVR